MTKLLHKVLVVQVSQKLCNVNDSTYKLKQMISLMHTIDTDFSIYIQKFSIATIIVLTCHFVSLFQDAKSCIIQCSNTQYGRNNVSFQTIS